MLHKTKKAMIRVMLFITVPLLLLSACSDKNGGREETGNSESQSNSESKAEPSYQELSVRLNAELAKKDFPEEANASIQEVFDKLWKNYPQWQGVYRDLPSVGDYIQTHLIDVIQEITSIEIIPADSEIGSVFLEAGEPLGATGESHRIRMIEMGGESHGDDIERLFHEITHCSQKTTFDDAYFGNDHDLMKVLTEGGATFHEKFVNPIDPRVYVTLRIITENRERSIEYKKDTAVGYLFQLNCYENFVYLAGYDLMQKIDREEIPVTEIKNAIAEKNGREIASGIWNDMQTLTRFFVKSIDLESDEAYQCAWNLQKQCLQCVKQDIADLDAGDPSAVKRYMDVYRNYKLKIMPQALQDFSKDITSEVFHMDELDQAITEKIIASSTLYFTAKEDLNRMAIQCVLLAIDNSYLGLDEREQVCLPPDIQNTSYEYVKDGLLKMTYTNADGKRVTIGVPFDENGIDRNGIKELS